MIKLIKILFAVVLLTGCECVPGLDTDKVLEPVYHSNLLVFHAVSDEEFININADDFILYENLERFSVQETYKKFPVKESGYVSVWNEDNNFRFINLPLLPVINKYYSLFLFGTKDEPEFTILNDFEDFSSGDSYLRILNLTAADITVANSINNNSDSLLLKTRQISDDIFVQNSNIQISLIANNEKFAEVSKFVNKNELVTLVILNTVNEPKYKIITLSKPT